MSDLEARLIDVAKISLLNKRLANSAYYALFGMDVASTAATIHKIGRATQL